MSTIAYLRVNNIGRSNNKSAVAAAAYRSGESYTDELRDHTYSYKGKHKEVRYHNVFLPEYAPEGHKDAQKLWNAVQWSESSGSESCRYAKQLEIVFPYGLSRKEQIQVVTKLADELTKKGYGVQVDIHDPYKPGKPRNPHAHVLITARRYNKDGSFDMSTPKQKKDYVYVLDESGNKIQERNPDGSLKFNQRKQPVYKREPLLDKNGNQKVKIRKGKGKELLWKTRTVEANYLDSSEALSEWKKIWADSCNEILVKKKMRPISFDRYTQQAELNLPENQQVIPKKHLSPAAYNIRGRSDERVAHNDIIRINKEVMKNLNVANKAEWAAALDKIPNIDQALQNNEYRSRLMFIADFQHSGRTKIESDYLAGAYYQITHFNKVDDDAIMEKLAERYPSECNIKEIVDAITDNSINYLDKITQETIRTLRTKCLNMIAKTKRKLQATQAKQGKGKPQNERK